jgi:hypothetical protein
LSTTAPAEPGSAAGSQVVHETSWRARPVWRFSWFRDGGVLAGVLIIAFVVLERWGRRFWFFFDDWDFLLRERLADQTSARDFLLLLFSPHNEHVSVLPRLWFMAADALFGLDSYAPYVTASIVVHLAAAVGGWVLLRQAGTDRLVCLLALLVMAFFGAGAENIFWGFQVGFMGGLMFGLMALAVTNRAGGCRRRDALGAVLLVAAVLSSGTGIPLVLAVGIAVFLRSGAVRSIAITLPALLMLAFARAIGAVGASGLGSPSAAIRFAGDELLFAIDAIFTWEVAGTVCLVGLLLVYALNRYRQVGHEWVAGMLVAALSFAVLTGISRSAGFAGPDTSRYLWFQAMLLVPVLAFLVSGAIRSPWVGRSIMLVIAVVALNHNIQLLREWSVSRPAGIAPNKALLLGLVRDPVLLLDLPGNSQPDPITSPQVTVQLLRDAVGRGEFSNSGR